MPLQILLIEDDMDDVELLQETFNNIKADYKMKVINDGDRAVDYVLSSTEYPDIIVMDLNLPKVHGKEILKQIKTHELYKRIPVIVLTTSSSADDKNYTLGLGADDYLIKPTSSKGLIHVAETILHVAANSNGGGGNNGRFA